MELQEDEEHNELSIADGKDPSFLGLLFIVALVFGVFFQVGLKKLPVYVIYYT